MKSTVETLSPTRVKLAVELPFDELAPSLDAAAKRVGSQLRVPGFRPGKVPARVVERRVGRAALLEEAINDALPKAYSAAVRDNDVKALGQPNIEVTELDDGKQVRFTAEVDVRPAITVPPLAELAVTVDDAAVSDDDVQAQLEQLQRRFATLVGVDRAIESGDFVSLDLATTVGGEPVEGGSATGLSYEVGSGDLIDGLDDAIVGLRAGESTSFDTTLSNSDRAGDPARVTVTVNSVKVRELPEVDDEFAAMASEFDTVAELRDDLRSRLQRVRLLEQGGQARDRVLEALLEQVEVPLPEATVAADVEWRKHDVIHGLDHDEDRLTELVRAQGQTREEFDAELRETAEKSVRAQFILDTIADAEQVSVTDTELTEYLVRQARRYEMSPQQFAQTLVENGSLPAVMADVRRNKALALALEAATVTDASGNQVDLSLLAPQQLAELAEAEPETELGEVRPDTEAELVDPEPVDPELVDPELVDPELVDGRPAGETGPLADEVAAADRDPATTRDGS